MINKPFLLLDWQQEFVDRFSVSDEQRSVLIAAPGTGKTVTSIEAMAKRARIRESAKIVVISHRGELKHQWAYVAEESKVSLSHDIDLKDKTRGASLTYQSLNNEERINSLRTLSSDGELLLVMDEADQYQKKAVSLCDELLALHPNNQCLFISRTPIIGLEQKKHISLAESTYLSLH